MNILAAICLNEEQFIEAWLRCHYDSFDRIIICEGAARNYPKDAVTEAGLSTDRTASVIKNYPDPEGKVSLIQYGWAGPQESTDPNVPAKMELRNIYADQIDSGYVFTLDIDEFLSADHVAALSNFMKSHPDLNAYFIPQLHLWQNTEHFITGGYADVPHCRLYRWKRNTIYKVNHNWPSGPDGKLLTDYSIRPKLMHSGGVNMTPTIVHYGFCENKAAMELKNRYYLNRGEEYTRPDTTRFRKAALMGVVPPGCEVHEYNGFRPIVL